MFNNISINHFFISLFYFHNLFLHLRFENLIKISIRTLLLFLSHIIFLLKTFIHKHFEGRKLDNSSICVLFSEISIVNRITSQSTSKSCRISTVLLNCINQGDKVSCRFRHFLSLDENITITIIGLRPEFRIIPDSNVIIKSHSQMIFNQIFS